MERSYCAVLSGVSEAGSDLITELRSIVTIRFSFVTDLSKLENLLNFDSKCTHAAPGGHIVVPGGTPTRPENGQFRLGNGVHRAQIWGFLAPGRGFSDGVENFEFWGRF